MKVELIGEHSRSIFAPKSPIRWDVWLNEHYLIASGRSRNRKTALKAADKAFKRFQLGISRVRKLSYMEWA